MLELSVIVCAHNPRPEYLRRVLASLEEQTLSVELWEFILVDNASKTALADSVDLSWHPRGRHVREAQLGLTAARLAGVSAAAGDLLVFVDDDNILDSEYLSAALRISKEWPKLGVWGGRIDPEFEVQPPQWTRKYWPLLAIRQLSADRWSNLVDQTETTPCGAGMCVRAVVARQYADMVRSDRRRLELGRKGASLASCEDTDLAFLACDLGYGTGLFESLSLMHLIPAARVTEEYLLGLVRAIAYSGSILRSLRGSKPHRPARSQRLFQSYVRMRLQPRERRFYDAAESGREAAFRQVAEW